MDLMAARRRLMVQMQELPSAYRRVEYLESSGNAYIDTGTPVTIDLVLEMRLQVPTPTKGKYILGRYLISGGAFYFYIANTQNLQLAYGCNYGNANYPVGSDVFDIKLEIENGKTNVYANNALIFQENALTTISTDSVKLIGAVNGASVPCITYSAKMSKSGVLVHNFIPCVRKSDSEAGMYDTVTKTFYTNIGTGSFIIPS